MRHYVRLAVLAGLALAADAAPADAHGAFGLFYDGCNKCCSGCPRPWNAFSAVCCSPGCGLPPGPMPCQPYQGPGDPRAGRIGLHGFFHGYGCGHPGVGCGMGQGLCGKVKGLFKKGCDGCDDGCGHGHGGCGYGGCAAGPVVAPPVVTPPVKKEEKKEIEKKDKPASLPAQLPTGVKPVSYQYSYPVYPAPQYPAYWGYGYHHAGWPGAF